MEGGCGVARVPAIDELDGFFFPKPTRLAPGMLHPAPLLQPEVNVATVSAAITTIGQTDFRMAFAPLICDRRRDAISGATDSSHQIASAFLFPEDTGYDETSLFPHNPCGRLANDLPSFFDRQIRLS